MPETVTKTRQKDILGTDIGVFIGYQCFYRTQEKLKWNEGKG